GSVSTQALRPCVAAYSLRAPGTMVSPATSTFGRPSPAATQLPAALPLGGLIPPKSVDAYRSPVTSSRTRSVAGRSPIGPVPPSRFVHVAVPAAGLYRTSNTWPGVGGGLPLYPEYEIPPWFASAGST